MTDELVIETSGWIEVSCDKCGTTSCYAPAFYKPETPCFGCMPVTSPEDFDRMVERDKLK